MSIVITVCSLNDTPGLLPPTRRRVYCSSRLKIDVVWIAYWYKPIFKKPSKSDSSGRVFEISSRMNSQLRHCLWFPSGRQSRAPRSLGGHTTVGEGWEGGRSSGEGRPQTPNGQSLQCCPLCPIPCPLCRVFCIFCHLHPSPQLPSYIFF